MFELFPIDAVFCVYLIIASSKTAELLQQLNLPNVE